MGRMVMSNDEVRTVAVIMRARLVNGLEFLADHYQKLLFRPSRRAPGGHCRT